MNITGVVPIIIKTLPTSLKVSLFFVNSATEIFI